MKQLLSVLLLPFLWGSVLAQDSSSSATATSSGEGASSVSASVSRSTTTSQPAPSPTPSAKVFIPPTPEQAAAWEANRVIDATIANGAVSVYSFSNDTNDPYVLAYILGTSPRPILTFVYYMTVPPYTAYGYSQMDLLYFVEFSDTVPIDTTSYINAANKFTWRPSFNVTVDSTGAKVINFTVSVNQAAFSLLSIPDVPFEAAIQCAISSKETVFNNRSVTPTALDINFNLKNYPFQIEGGRPSLLFRSVNGEIPMLVNQSALQFGVGGFLLTFNNGGVPNNRRLQSQMWGPDWYVVVATNTPLNRNINLRSTLAFPLAARTPKSNVTAPTVHPYRSHENFTRLTQRADLFFLPDWDRGEVGLRSQSLVPNVRESTEVVFNVWWNGHYITHRSDRFGNGTVNYLGQLFLPYIYLTTPGGVRFVYEFNWNHASYWMNQNAWGNNYTEPDTNATIFETVWWRTYSFVNATTGDYLDSRNVSVFVAAYMTSAPCTWNNMALRPNTVKFVVSNTQAPSTHGGRNSNVTYPFKLGASQIAGISGSRFTLAGRAGSVEFGNATSNGNRTNFRLLSSNYIPDNEVNTWMISFDGPNTANKVELNFNINTTTLLSDASVDALKAFAESGAPLVSNMYGLYPPVQKNTTNATTSASASASASSAGSTSAARSTTSSATGTVNNAASSSTAASSSAAAPTASKVSFERNYPNRELYSSYSKVVKDVGAVYNRKVTCDSSATSFGCLSVSSTVGKKAGGLYLNFSLEPQPRFDVSFYQFTGDNDNSGTLVSSFRYDITMVTEYNSSISKAVTPNTWNLTAKPQNSSFPVISNIVYTKVAEKGVNVHSFRIGATYQRADGASALALSGVLNVSEAPSSIDVYSTSTAAYSYQAMGEGITYLFNAVWGNSLGGSTFAVQSFVSNNDVTSTLSAPNPGLIPADKDGISLIRYFPSNKDMASDTIMPVTFEASSGATFSATNYTNVRGFQLSSDDKGSLQFGGEVGMDLFRLSAQAILGELKNSAAVVSPCLSIVITILSVVTFHLSF
jgi:hypothetical protein